jgi:D-alanyl-D-alanine carboxypeptidase
VADDTIALMEYGFNNFARTTLARRGETVGSARVRGGSAKEIPVAPTSDLLVVVPKWRRPEIKLETRARTISAPSRKGVNAGTVTAYVDGKPAVTAGLATERTARRGLTLVLFPWMRNGFILMIGLLVSKRYGRAVAEGARGGRRRIAQEVRRANRRRQG